MNIYGKFQASNMLALAGGVGVHYSDYSSSWTETGVVNWK